MDDGSADITEQSGEDLIATLTAEAKQKSKSRKKKKIEEYKAIRATKDAIFSRLGRTIDVPIIMDDEEIMVFKVKRLSESENSDIIDRTLAVKNVKEMTPEELEESTKYNYRLLEGCRLTQHNIGPVNGSDVVSEDIQGVANRRVWKMCNIRNPRDQTCELGCPTTTTGVYQGSVETEKTAGSQASRLVSAGKYNRGNERIN